MDITFVKIKKKFKNFKLGYIGYMYIFRSFMMFFNFNVLRKNFIVLL